jgi:hypothetical protein
MTERIFLVGLALVVALVVLTPSAWAADKTHDGIVVSTAEGKLVMTDKDGKNEHTHTIGAAAKITLDGKAAKLADLKKGDAVKVTAGEDGAVKSVAATRAKE